MLCNLVTVFFQRGGGWGLSVFTAIPKIKSKIYFLTLDSLAHWDAGQYLRGMSVFAKIPSQHH